MCYNISNCCYFLESWSKMDVQVGDILEMKKTHPCGEKKFTVLRSGIDFRLRCNNCGREFLIPRVKAEKNIKKVIREKSND